LGDPGAETCNYSEDENGCSLAGTVVTALAGRPYQLEYRLSCDLTGQTRSVEVSLASGSLRRELALSVDADRRWWQSGQELSLLRGLLDADLSFSPSTNTLPIRRLGLLAGEHADLTAAWVRVPELSVEPLAQTYTRLGEFRYRFESHPGDFTVELEVDEFGLVVRYAGLWERAAASL
jgi:hypothetical protein